MDQEPGDAAGEVSPSVHYGRGCGQASSGACRHGAASSLHTGPRAPSLCVGRPPGGPGSRPVPLHAHVTCCHPPLLAGSQASHSTKQPFRHQHRHRVGAQDCHRLRAVPAALSPRASLGGVGTQHPAPCARPRGGSQPPPVKHTSPAVCPAWPAAIPTESPVPCRVSRDTRTTRTPGCSGWAPAIASSPSGSARYGPHREGDPGATGMSYGGCARAPRCFLGGLSPMKAGGPLTR